MYKKEYKMVSFLKKTSLFVLSLTTLLLLNGCSPVGDEENAVSGSTSSSETGDGFIVQYDGTFSHQASVVIGQADFVSSGDEATAANTVSSPYANPTVVDGMLYLPDFNNNRILGFNSVPTTNGKAGNFAIGQDSLVDNLIGSTAFRNEGAQTVTTYNGKFFLTDWGNSRILIYNQRPVSGPGEANVVVGQTAFGESLPGLSNSRLYLPESLSVANGKLIVADSRNNRVLIWNTIPTTNGAAADLVLGQSDFVHRDVLDPPTASSLNFPTAVWSDGTRLLVLDAGNNRVLLWTTFPTSSNQTATYVLGQVDFTSNLANQDGGTTPSSTSLSFTTQGGGLYSNGTQIFVADSGNNRVMIWNTFPSSDGAAATGLIGQDAFDTALVNQRLTPAQDSFLNPTGVYQFYNKLIVTDSDNNRYLIFNSL